MRRIGNFETEEMTRILVTGGSGFVGRRLIEKIISVTDYHVGAMVRHVPAQPVKNVVYHHVPDFSIIDTDLNALKGADVVIHLASRVHVMNDKEVDPLAAFRLVNVSYTLKLARSAAMAGAKRFIFVSSVKVNGEGTVLGRGIAQAQADWMSTGTVSFTAIVQFTAPRGTTGTVVLSKDNPSGLPKNDASLVIPVGFR